jgi:hypothetical protein
VYFYPAEKYLGVAFRLQKLQFWIDKEQDLIEWRCWEIIAMALINIGAPTKIETYSGDATTLDANAIAANVQPVAESAVGITNNRVEDDLIFPQIKFY